ncbi:MAG TPA: DUF3667 domain-containing protein [Cyclobacteriaceae bacterium]|nr:DUF3667 domain-containing protein [Cyclobacteriaceae bacterium]
MNCINCENEVTGNFCSHCAQSTKTHRINFKEAWHDFWSRVYGFDGMMPRTLRDLTLRPGLVGREYLRGVRVKYYGPVGYFFLMITVYLLVVGLLGVDFKLLVGKSRSLVPATTEESKLFKVTMEFVADNIKLIAFAIVPFQAMASRYFFFRGRGLNYLEHWVMPFYLMGHGYWLSILAVIIYAISGSLSFNLWLIIILIPYYGFGYASFFPDGSKIKTFLKGIAIYLAGQLLMTAVVTVLVLIVILLFAWLSPETLEFIKPSLNR